MQNIVIRALTDKNKTITETVKEERLKWFGCICKKENSSIVYTAYKQDFVKPIPRGRPPKRWTDMIQQDTGLPLLTAERNASDRNSWRRMLREQVIFNELKFHFLIFTLFRLNKNIRSSFYYLKTYAFLLYLHKM